ncbi:MAG: tetratricopeptide repeat protein, partial [Minicystis sp.]
MAPPEPPAPPRGASVTSLLDRLQPAQRARHLTALTLRTQARDPVHLARLAELAARLEAFDAADTLAQLERAPRETPEIRQVKMICEASLAAQRYLRGDADGALSDFAAMIAAHPEDAAEAHYFRSFFLELRGEIDAAIADVTRMITLAPLNAGAYARRGEIYHGAGQHGEALANFRRAAQLDSDNLGALSGAGVCLMLARDWDGAIPWLTRAMRLHPQAPSLRVERALCFENLERYDEAVADLDVAITLAPDDDESLYARGRCRPKSGRTEEIADYTRALEIAPERADIWMARGRAHLENQALDEALADVTRAVELEPTDAKTHLFRALIHHAAGHPARAKESYDEAHRLDPTEVTHLTAYARVNDALRDPHALLGDLDALVALAPARPELRLVRARLLMKEGAIERALADFDAALALLERAPLP